MSPTTIYSSTVLMYSLEVLCFSIFHPLLLSTFTPLHLFDNYSKQIWIIQCWSATARDIGKCFGQWENRVMTTNCKRMLHQWKQYYCILTFFGFGQPQKSQIEKKSNWPDNIQIQLGLLHDMVNTYYRDYSDVMVIFSWISGNDRLCMGYAIYNFSWTNILKRTCFRSLGEQFVGRLCRFTVLNYFVTHVTKTCSFMHLDILGFQVYFV